MDAELTWLLAWFKARRPDIVPPAERLDVFNYFEAGWIDSMGIIELIADAEARFGMQFSHEDFQDRRFATLGGLAAMVAARKIREAGHAS